MNPIPFPTPLRLGGLVALILAGGSPSALADPAADLALGYCLHASGLATQQQSYQFVASRGERQGWPQDWYRAVAPEQIQAVITSAGGCARLLRLSQQGRPPLPMSPGPASAPGSRSAGEGFGLAPYR
jgi:hypothetical protein